MAITNVQPRFVSMKSRNEWLYELVIDGTGACKGINIDWGDSTQIDTIGPPIAFPLIPQHTYTQAKPYIITVSGDCAKQPIEIPITVYDLAEKGLSEVKDRVRMTEMFTLYECTRIKVNSIVWQYPVPGGPLVFDGCGFGTEGDNVPFRAEILLTDYSGQPVRPEYSELKVIGRNDQRVSLQIAEGIDGVLDQRAEVRLYRGAERYPYHSPPDNPIFVDFKAIQDEKPLMVDNSLQMVACGHEAAFNFCSPGRGWETYYVPPNCTFAGWHEDWSLGFLFSGFSDDEGTDKYTITLKNGWVLDYYDFARSVIEDEVHVSDPWPPFPSGANAWQPEVAWWTSPQDTAWYKAYVFIRGPIGVPWT